MGRSDILSLERVHIRVVLVLGSAERSSDSPIRLSEWWYLSSEWHNGQLLNFVSVLTVLGITLWLSCKIERTKFGHGYCHASKTTCLGCVLSANQNLSPSPFILFKKWIFKNSFLVDPPVWVRCSQKVSVLCYTECPNEELTTTLSSQNSQNMSNLILKGRNIMIKFNPKLYLLWP